MLRITYTERFQKHYKKLTSGRDNESLGDGYQVTHFVCESPGDSYQVTHFFIEVMLFAYILL